MTRLIRMPQTSFTAGELAPSMAGRIETTRYYSGAQRLENVLVIPQGGVKRRPGMRHIEQVPGGLDGCRLIPFAFNTEQTYAILLVAGAFRVYRSDGTWLATVTGCPWSGPQAAEINHAQSADSLILVHRDIQPQLIQRGATESVWTRTQITLVNLPQHNFGAGPEPVVSGGRGWPECCTFHQGRLWFGGFRSRPASFMASRVGDFFNFALGSALDDEAIYGTIDTDQVNAIHQIASGRTLQIFTSGAEHGVLVEPPITPKNIAVQEQTRRGIRRFSRLGEVDGAAIFVARGGAALRQFLYSEVEQAYQSDLLSLLAPHLMRDVQDIQARKGSVLDDADHVLLLNADGQPTVLTTLRAQEVAAFTRWTTAGQIRSAAALASGQVFFAVVRAGGLRVETWAETRLLDASARVISGAPITAVAGLSHLDGLDCAVYADGCFVGRAVPAGGVIILDQPARDIEVGLAFVPRVEPMPVEPRDPSGNLIGRRCRPAQITLRVEDTATFEVNGRPVIFRTLGDAQPGFDTPAPRQTGDVRVHGLLGWRQRYVLAIAQPVPGPFRLLALSYQLAVGE